MKLDPALFTNTPLEVYEPREDTFFLLDCLELEAGDETVLEMGAGSGLISLHLAKAGLAVTAVDINPHSIKHIEDTFDNLSLPVETFLSDMFENVRGTFDVVLFNSPYLEMSCEDFLLRGTDRQALIGGVKGFEIARRFVLEVQKHLNGNGRAYLLLQKDHWEMAVADSLLEWKKVRENDSHGEKLVVLKGRFNWQ